MAMISTVLRRTVGRNAAVNARASVRFVSTIEEAQEIDQRATQAFKDHPLAFTNLPVSELRFAVGSHFVSGEPHPYVYFSNNEDPGILHLTPWAVSRFSHFGKLGNFGRRIEFPSGVVEIDSLEDCEQEVGIANAPLVIDGEPNTLFDDYVEWLEGVQDKYIEHLATNIDAYPSLKKKFSFMIERGGDDMLLDALRAGPSKLYSEMTTDDGNTSRLIRFNRKIYVRDAEKAAKMPSLCPEDDEMKAKGMIRRHVRLYDSNAHEIPLEKATLRPNDVISCRINIMCNLYNVASNVGYGLRRNLRDVTLLRHGVQPARAGNEGEGAPFGNLGSSPFGAL